MPPRFQFIVTHDQLSINGPENPADILNIPLDNGPIEFEGGLIISNQCCQVEVTQRPENCRDRDLLVNDSVLVIYYGNSLWIKQSDLLIWTHPDSGDDKNECAGMCKGCSCYAETQETQ